MTDKDDLTMITAPPPGSRPHTRDEVLRPYRFAGGPWDGKTTHQPRALTGPVNCMPNADTPDAGGTWASADTWPRRNRYIPTGTDGDTILMAWRLPTAAELNVAKVIRAVRAEEKLQEYALDAADEENHPYPEY